MSSNKNLVSFLGNSSLFVLLVVVVALVVLPSLGVSNDTNSPKETPCKIPAEVLENFRAEVQKAVDAKESETLDVLAEQNLLLEEILDGVNKLAPKPGAAIEEVQKPKETAVEQVQNEVKQEPIRMSSTTWNINGDWDFTEGDLRNHVETVHGLEELNEYSLEEVTVIHDNMHNGYTPFGSVIQTSKPPVRVTGPRVRLIPPLFRNRRSNASCPTGGCP
jgi:hypothetical protein